MGEITDPWGTPARTAWQVDVVSLYLQDAILPRRYAESHRMMLWWRPVALIASISLVWMGVAGRGYPRVGCGRQVLQLTQRLLIWNVEVNE